MLLSRLALQQISPTEEEQKSSHFLCNKHYLFINVYILIKAVKYF